MKYCFKSTWRRCETSNLRTESVTRIESFPKKQVFHKLQIIIYYYLNLSSHCANGAVSRRQAGLSRNGPSIPCRVEGFLSTPKPRPSFTGTQPPIQ